MKEISNLAKEFEQNLNKTAQTIKDEVGSVISGIKTSTIEKVEESENTIKDGITKSRHRITEHEEKNEKLIKTQITTSGQNVITQVQETETETTQALNSLRKVIRKLLNHLGAVALIAFAIFAFGMLVGVVSMKLINKQNYPTYQYYHDSQTGKTYMIPLEK